MTEASFKLYIYRTLKSVDDGIHITKPSIEALDSILQRIATKSVDIALSLSQETGKKTVSVDELTTALKSFLPESLYMSGVQYAEKAIKTFSTNHDEKVQSRETRAGIIFSVSTTEKFIRKSGQHALNVAGTSPIFLSSVLETVTKSFLREIIKVTESFDKITITNRHILLAVSGNGELKSLLDTLQVTLLEGGVEPQEISVKKHTKVRKHSSSRHFRTGTKTVLKIRKYQKESRNLIQRAPFNRLVRELTGKFLESARFTNDFLTSLQSFTESRIIHMMSQANLLAHHANRETVYARDVELLNILTGKSLDVEMSESSIPEAALRHLALRAGIKRFGDDSVGIYRKWIVQTLTEYMKMISLCAQHRKVHTLNTKLLIAGLGMLGLHPSIVAKRKKRRVSTSSRRVSDTVSVTSENTVAESLAGDSAYQSSDDEDDEDESEAGHHVNNSSSSSSEEEEDESSMSSSEEEEKEERKPKVTKNNRKIRVGLESTLVAPDLSDIEEEPSDS